MAADPEKEIETRAQALAKSINNALKTHYAKAKTAKTKQMAVQVSRNKAGRFRTPAQQAQSVLAKRSWTCNSGHMFEGARHILILMGGAPQWKLGELKKGDPAAWKVLEGTWNAGFGAHKLVNYGRGKKFPAPGDALHIELPDARGKEDNTNKRMMKCINIYWNATRLKGKAKNVAYETNPKKGSKFQRTWLKNADKKLAKKKAVP